jgi:hypothetical protein
VRLEIAPDSALLDLPQVSVPPLSQSTPEWTFIYSDELMIYPRMIAQLVGVNFVVSGDDFPEKPVTSDSTVEWIWSISIYVESPIAPTPTETAQPTPTSTPLPPMTRLGEQLLANTGVIAVALIGLCGGFITLFGVLAGVYVNHLNNQKTNATSENPKLPVSPRNRSRGGKKK